MNTIDRTETPAPRFAKRKKAREKPLENILQTHFVAELMKLQAEGYTFTYAGDMNAGRRSAYERAWATATGMMAGEPDLRLYLPGGRMILVELKREKKAGGRLSKDQKERHDLLRSLGFDVRVEHITDEKHARAVARSIIEDSCEIQPACSG